MDDEIFIDYQEGKNGSEIISEIINNVYDFVEDWSKDKRPETIFLYRGQSNSEWKLIPGLFRLSKRDVDFESNMIHFLKAKKFVNDTDELTVSIDAQHYSYPTRLLDVSYNMLNALFFACEDTTENEINKNGALFIIRVNLQRPATSQNLHVIYKEIIENSSFFENMIVNEKYLFVERINQNNRIIAQDGGLIVFIENKPLAEQNYKKIIIHFKNKKIILDCLAKYFNINHGNMFPDMENNRDIYVDLATKQIFSKKSDWNLGDEIISGYVDEKYKKMKEDAKDTQIRIRDIKRLIRRLNCIMNDFEGSNAVSTYKNYINSKIKELKKEIENEQISD